METIPGNTVYTFDSQYQCFIISCENAGEINKNAASTMTSPYTAVCDRGAGRGVPGEYAPSDFTDVDERTEAEIDSQLIY